MTVVLIRTGAKDGGGDAENPAAGNKKSILNCLMKYSSTVLKDPIMGLCFQQKIYDDSKRQFLKNDEFFRHFFLVL